MSRHKWTIEEDIRAGELCEKILKGVIGDDLPLAVSLDVLARCAAAMIAGAEHLDGSGPITDEDAHRMAYAHCMDVSIYVRRYREQVVR